MLIFIALKLGLVLDQSALLAKAHFSSGMAYHTGREIARLATFVNEYWSPRVVGELNGQYVS